MAIGAGGAVSAPASGSGLGGTDMLSALVLFVSGLVGYGKLRGDVVSLRRDIDAKAAKETMETQYAAILRELADIKDKIKDICQ